jgi:hypothetical protein
VSEKIATVTGMCRTQMVGYQLLDRLADKCFMLITEKRIYLTVGKHDAPVTTGDNDGIGEAIEDSFKRRTAGIKKSISGKQPGTHLLLILPLRTRPSNDVVESEALKQVYLIVPRCTISASIGCLVGGRLTVELP